MLDSRRDGASANCAECCHLRPRYRRPRVRPDREMGYRACVNATNDQVPMGQIGAGTGATVGKAPGLQPSNGGVGSACHALKSGLIVGAIVVVTQSETLLIQRQEKLWQAQSTRKQGEFVDIVKRLSQQVALNPDFIGGREEPFQPTIRIQPSVSLGQTLHSPHRNYESRADSARRFSADDSPGAYHVRWRYNFSRFRSERMTYRSIPLGLSQRRLWQRQSVALCNTGWYEIVKPHIRIFGPAGRGLREILDFSCLTVWRIAPLKPCDSCKISICSACRSTCWLKCIIIA